MRRLSVYCLLQESLYLYLYLFPFSAFPSVSSLPLVQAMGRPHQWEDLQTIMEGAWGCIRFDTYSSIFGGRHGIAEC